VYIVDAFTSRPFAGNPAGVVTRADGLSDEQMQAIARELGQSETCFVLEGGEAGIDYRLRWFTPTVEVDLCGHATVAAYTCLAAEGRVRFGGGPSHLRHATRRGILGVWVLGEAREAHYVSMSAGVTSLQAAPDDRTEVAYAVGLDPRSVDLDLPLAADEASQRIIIPVRRLADLLALVPDSAGMIRYGQRAPYRRFTLVSQETLDPRCRTHLRHFAPANGIPEDPVTGTAHAAVAAYLEWLGLQPPGERILYEGEQGHAVKRPGSVTVELLRKGKAVADVRIGGRGIIVARGEIETDQPGLSPNVEYRRRNIE
jgi:PhzF family phenazine biosynthesis protein